MVFDSKQELTSIHHKWGCLTARDVQDLLYPTTAAVTGCRWGIDTEDKIAFISPAPAVTIEEAALATSKTGDQMLCAPTLTPRLWRRIVQAGEGHFDNDDDDDARHGLVARNWPCAWDAIA